MNEKTRCSLGDNIEMDLKEYHCRVWDGFVCFTSRSDKKF